ncbi:hypothetical protein JCM19239_6045 [Vibrio variabilis]|uniref:Uncharacterized protein n=1 Tax=Vibrio variabilis TaxID=990271 RepID=A0ABQ0JLQ8_9VIBR|nr:hypothetical protein JCM19239_6045 [Vibrio variabilis]
MMDCSTGRLIQFEGTDQEREEQLKKIEQAARHQMLSLNEEEVKELKPLAGYKRKGRVRNWLCRCGSGLKFKLCCWDKYI